MYPKPIEMAAGVSTKPWMRMKTMLHPPIVRVVVAPGAVVEVGVEAGDKATVPVPAGAVPAVKVPIGVGAAAVTMVNPSP